MKKAMKTMRNKGFFTIPNFTSLFRILLIPMIVWFYAVGIIALSALTDKMNSKIARRFNMISDVGMILDPVADKLPQAALIICLVSKYKLALRLFILFIVREATMGVLGYITLKETQSVNSAKWHGKATTALIYASIMTLILFPDIPVRATNLVITTCATAIIIAWFMYCMFYRKILFGRLGTGYLKKNYRTLLNGFHMHMGGHNSFVNILPQIPDARKYCRHDPIKFLPGCACSAGFVCAEEPDCGHLCTFALCRQRPAFSIARCHRNQSAGDDYHELHTI